jgi:hypothetical protein
MIGHAGGALFKIGCELCEQVTKQILKTAATEIPKVVKGIKTPKRV